MCWRYSEGGEGAAAHLHIRADDVQPPGADLKRERRLGEEGEHLSRRDDGLGGVVDELSGIRQARKGTLRADGHGSPQPLQVFG